MYFLKKNLVFKLCVFILFKAVTKTYIGTKLKVIHEKLPKKAYVLWKTLLVEYIS